MGNVAKNRHDQAVKIVSKALRSSKDKRDDALRELIEFCADGIAKGLNEGGILLAFSAPQHKADIARALAYRSAERVIGTAKEKAPGFAGIHPSLRDRGRTRNQGGAGGMVERAEAEAASQHAPALSASRRRSGT